MTVAACVAWFLAGVFACGCVVMAVAIGRQARNETPSEDWDSEGHQGAQWFI